MGCFERQKYTIIKKISDGGFSNVFLAENSGNGCFAIKITKQQSNEFKKEYDILYSINHPFICKCIELTQLYSRVALVLSFVDGVELYHILCQKQKLSYNETIFTSACILSALIYLHDLNIVYRDIKPENIIVNQNGYAILVDFGFAKKIKYTTKTYCGTHGYMAPEIQQYKPYTLSVDMYSFGVLLYELYTGFLPHNNLNIISNPHLLSCISNLLSHNAHERKSALALRWSHIYNDLDFDFDL